jgi:hypothetical protein
MTPERLPRWIVTSSDASPELREAVTELCNEVDDTARAARLETRLAGLFGATFDAPAATGSPAGSTGPAPSAAPGAASSTGGVVLKLGIFVVGVGVVAAAVSSLIANDAQPRLPSASAHSTKSDPLSVARAVPSATPLRASVLSVASSQPDSRASSKAVPTVARAASAPQTTRPEPSSMPIGSISEEARLLRRARAEFATSPEQALSLLGEHERRFPGGALRDERELFAIEVLARIGSSEQALERFERFRKTSPDSPYVVTAERIVKKLKAR